MASSTIIVPPPKSAGFGNAMYAFFHTKMVLYVGISAFLLVGLLIGKNIQNPLSLLSRASNDTAKIFIQPAQYTMSPGGIFQIWATTTHPVKITRIVIHFDKTYLKMTKDVSFENAVMTKISYVTTPEEANTIGSITIDVGSEPSERQSPLNGTFLIGTLAFETNTSETNISTTISPEISLTSVSENDKKTIEITSENAQILLNPAATVINTPTNTPIDTPTETIQPTPTNAPIQTQTPTSTILPQPTPTTTPLPLTPTITLLPSPTGPMTMTFEFRIRLDGVQTAAASSTLATVRFVKSTLDLITPPLPVSYIGNGIYRLTFTTTSNLLPIGAGYTIIIKAQKHVATKYCKSSGQTDVCQPLESLAITTPFLYDFTGFSLAVGDLYIQDGKADSNDFTKIKSRMNIPCENLTLEDKFIADVDYNGCVNSLDAYWMRKTLETRYDEN